MQKIKVIDFDPQVVGGVDVQMPDAGIMEKEQYFEWEPSSLIIKFKTPLISGGILRSFKHDFTFKEVETHIDAELFFFRSGIAIMPFIDIIDGKLLMGSAQIVRILPGTQIIIPAGKGHFVPLPEGEKSLEIIVVAPKMGDITTELPEAITADFT